MKRFSMNILTQAGAHPPGMAREIAGSVPKHILIAVLAVMVVGFVTVTGSQAALITAGNISPSDPSAWTSTTTAYVGNASDGSLIINDGSDVASYSAYLGYSTGAAGAVTVDGTGSTWANSRNFYVGHNGTGSLVITNGGTVNSGAYEAGLGAYSGGSGTVTVDGTGSTLTNSNYFYVGIFGSGSLSVVNGGTVSNSNTFIGTRSGGSGTVIVDGAGSTLTNSNYLYVGLYGIGNLSIMGGGTVSNTGIVIGHGPGGSGTVIVDGAGSTLTNNGTLYVGAYCPGSLSITGGGMVSNGSTTIGYGSGGSGTVIVDGAGSTLTNNGTLYVGESGTGSLSITNGGTVTASTVSINSSSLLTTDVGHGSSLIAGAVTNNGAIRFVAGAAAGGTYTPISAGTWNNSGTIQTLGGVWDAGNHTVTVSAAALGIAGTATTIDLASTQRIFVTDSASGRSVGASFQGTSVSTDLTLVANPISDAELTLLQGSLGSGDAVLSGWNFTITEGYTEGEPVYLSLYAGSGQSLSDLTIWHYDGSVWSAYTVSDLTYDGTYANFTVTGFSGYAVAGTAPVPIPAAAWLLGSGLIGLAGFRRRFKR